MPPFLYQCPTTRRRVQGWTETEPADDDRDSFETVTCPACGQVHLVNPRSGRTLGTEADE